MPVTGCLCLLDKDLDKGLGPELAHHVPASWQHYTRAQLAVAGPARRGRKLRPDTMHEASLLMHTAASGSSCQVAGSLS